MPNERAIQTQAPIDRPTFAILIEGEDISREYQVAALTVIKQVNRISTAKILLHDGDPARGDFEVSNSEMFIPGKEIEICGGYHSLENTLFRGIITGHGIKARQRRPSMLSIECRHSAFRMSLYRRSAYFSELKDSDLFTQMAENYSIGSEIEETSVEHAELVQYNCTDWDFMLTRAEANGQQVLTNRNELQIGPPDFSADPVQTLTYGATLLEFEAEIDARDQIASVSSESWDSAGQELFSRDGSADEVETPGDLLFEELADVAAQQAPVQRSGSQLREDELQAWSDARLQKQRLAKVQGRARCTGIDVNPGDLIELEGVGDRFRGRAFVSGIRHEFSGGPWTTDIDIGLPAEWFAEKFPVSSPPASALLPAVSGLQIGIVTAIVGDPDGEDRVRVRVPVIAPDVDGVWARVACLDAGEERGTFWRPEIEDEVVLGFLNDDPRDAIILGMLNSSAKPAPLASSDDNHEKGIVTRSGMKMIWNDEKVSLTIETPAGKKIVIDDDAESILLEDDYSNKLEMNSAGISYESQGDITIKATGDLKLEGMNVEVKAQMEMKAEGGVEAKLVGGATAKVEAGVVMIN
ncbi:Rhs element Vgr protein [Malonomonas rubra DSM 5091]|uniref:Rhs element Vgr protein n=1 Tax=Malonomonas rubra DSM 5091 TaxID=1122189 RepID=A0A1M6M0B9_MALRU|nr:type VI secretion system tip protein VgrG [Malonomonas rubra]SHJ76921.1 Rhs element Vgr protein [Malonomonas rubra DSM 5091]